jgi:hypothetical protein
MTEIITDGLTRVSWIPAGGPPVDLGGLVKNVRFERVTEENFLDGWARPIRITVRGQADRLTPLTYRLLLGRTHPRLARMHAAYRRRQGRGRRS